MKLWSSLYAMTWLLFFDFWLSLTPILPPYPRYLHMALGIAIVTLAYSNAEALRSTAVPARIKRISRATFQLSLLMALLGVLIYLGVGATVPLVLGVTLAGVFVFVHFVNAMAMITQSAASAIAYDMWEDREFERNTRPGDVPAAAPQPDSA
jgi:hypothetical protein